MANQVETGRIVGIVEEATLRENGMTFLAQIPTPMLFASEQFRQRELQTYINGDCSKGDGMVVRVSPTPPLLFLSLLPPAPFGRSC